MWPEAVSLQLRPRAFWELRMGERTWGHSATSGSNLTLEVKPAAWAKASRLQGQMANVAMSTQWGIWSIHSKLMALVQMEATHFKTFRNGVFQTMKWYPGVPNSPATAHLPWFFIYHGTEEHFITLMTRAKVLYKHHLGFHPFQCLVVEEKIQCLPSISQNILSITVTVSLYLKSCCSFMIKKCFRKRK